MLLEILTKILEKQREIKKKLAHHEISVLESELEIKELVHEIEKAVQKDTFNHLTEPTQLNSIPCKCLSDAKYKASDTKKLETGRTQIKIRRRRYYCKNCKTTIYPLDAAYGLVGVHGFSPNLCLMSAYLSGHLSYERSRRVLAELLNINISGTAVQNQSEKLGKEVFRAKLSYIPSEQQRRPDKLIIMADGGMLHTGKEGYKETRAGVILKFFVNGGITTHKLAICESTKDFIRDFDLFSRAHGTLACENVVIIGDGASWLDTLKNDCFPTARRIIDYYHAKEYLIGALKELYGLEWSSKGKSHYLLGLLENGECLEIAQEFKGCSDKGSAQFKLKRYYKNHYEKMR